MSAHSHSRTSKADAGQAAFDFQPPEPLPIQVSAATTLVTVIVEDVTLPLRANPILSVRSKRGRVSAVLTLEQLTDTRLAEMPAIPSSLNQACQSLSSGRNVLPPVAPDVAPAATTLADVVARLQVDPALSIRRRRDLISAVRTLGRLAGTRLADMPTSPANLRQVFDTLSPAAAGLSEDRWNNIRSLVPAALRHAGVRTMARRTREPLAPEWQDLREQLPTTRLRIGLSRFMSSCSLEGILPADVTGPIFERFARALRQDTIIEKPKQVYRTTCLFWNQAAQEITGWPKLSVPVPNENRRYAMFWEELPATFQVDAEAFLSRMGNQDPFAEDYAPSVRPRTVELRRKQILQMSTALVQSGVPVDRIINLAILVQPDNAKRILRFFLDRKKAKEANKLSTYLHQQAILLKTIARHWVKLPPDQVETLGTFARNLAVKKTGMTEKNRSRLRQFDNPANVTALLHLPATTLATVKRKNDQSRSSAQRVMLALAVELLLVAPMRIENLAELESERHLPRVKVGSSTTTHVAIPAKEIKNGVPIELELPADTERLLSIYCAEYRPRLTSTAGPYLFPNGQGKQRSITPFAQAICVFIKRETGIKMNVHLFRHFAVKLHLEAHPEDIETARRVLGHKSTTTTLRAYADLKTASAFRRYDALIANLRAQPAVPVRRARRSGGAS